MRRQCRTSDSAVELILPGRGSGSKSATAMGRNDDVDGLGMEDLLEGPPIVVDVADFEGDQVQAIALAEPFFAELCQPVKLGRGVAGVEIEHGRAAKTEAGRSECECARTVAPRSRHASVMAAANRPEETLVIKRTSSIGAIVPPAGHDDVDRRFAVHEGRSHPLVRNL